MVDRMAGTLPCCYSGPVGSETKSGEIPALSRNGYTSQVTCLLVSPVEF